MAVEVAVEHVDEALRLHFLDIGTRREGLLAAGDQDAADLVVGLEIVHRRGDLAEHAERQRVQHFRPVQRDDADRSLAFDDDEFERSHDANPVPDFPGNVPAGGMRFKWLKRLWSAVRRYPRRKPRGPQARP
ncbi:hypothetical protein ACVWW1_009505 [Bradyrhizobium sp. JR3.5]